MAEFKLGVFFLQLLGFSSYLWSFVASFGDIKSLVLFLVGLTFAGYKVFNAHLDSVKKKWILTTINKIE